MGKTYLDHTFWLFVTSRIKTFLSLVIDKFQKERYTLVPEEKRGYRGDSR